MRLSNVTVSGFKSFADTVTFHFDQPKVGIVGPNGCGKSNVVDAVKWVLGERSAKSLRGGAMMDKLAELFDEEADKGASSSRRVA